MSEFKYPHLFEPFKLAGVTYRNRIFTAPLDLQDTDSAGLYYNSAADFYERRAMGGAAVVTMGEIWVDEKRITPGYHTVIANSYTWHGLSKISGAITRHGAVASGELQAPGLLANRHLSVTDDEWGDIKPDTIGPVDMEYGGRPVRACTEEDIAYMIRKYVEAAKLCKKLGYGMVNVHAGHGWFFHQFLSPSINTRTDKWGGAPVENRARILLETVKGIRRECGKDFPIEVRLSASEIVEGGYGIDEGIAIAKQLDGYVDLINCTVGTFSDMGAFFRTHPNLFKEDGCNLEFAEAIKKEMEYTKVSAVGALNEPEMLEEAIASGKCDVVEICRGLMTDPDMPLKLRAGREDDVRQCIRCLACFSASEKKGQFYCSVNPESSREWQFKYLLPVADKKKVLVIGGGIAGMEAALIAARNGHTVTLCEKKGQLGGVLRCEDEVPFKHKLRGYLDYQARQLEKAGVEIKLNCEVTPEMAEAGAYDVVIACIGGASVVPPIPGIDGANVMPATEAFANIDKVGDKVVIIGAGLVGLEMAVYFGEAGKKVDIIEITDHVNDGDNFLHTEGVRLEGLKYGVEIHYETKAEEITAEGVKCTDKDGAEVFYPADTVVYAVGEKALTDEAYAFNLTAPEFYCIGDCVAPANIIEATSTAFTIANYLGRPLC